ncbi:MAG TPA: hypothetical protein VMU54_22310 [Planctomycetota bacterium]|nr:hypothetical protein [Planctomycetota bacterium]
MQRQGYLEVVLQPTTSSDDIKRQFEEILQICMVRKPSRLFVDFTPISGKFTTLERYDLGMIGARFVPYVDRVAVLVTPEVRDPEKLGSQVARNRGLNTDNFVDRAAALAWLLGR